jgi:hypothetical protein
MLLGLVGYLLPKWQQVYVQSIGDFKTRWPLCWCLGGEGGWKWIKSPHYEEKIFEVRYLGSNMLQKYRSNPKGYVIFQVQKMLTNSYTKDPPLA